MRESEVRLACHHGFLVEVGRLEMGVCPTPGGEGRLPLHPQVAMPLLASRRGMEKA